MEIQIKKNRIEDLDKCITQGRIQGGGGGGGTRRAPPLKLEKIWFFGVKSWFFTRNTPKMFAPPSARRIFFNCAPPPPLTWNPESAPVTLSDIMDSFNQGHRKLRSSTKSVYGINWTGECMDGRAVTNNNTHLSYSTLT